MRTAISHGEWQPWTSVSALLWPHKHGVAVGQKPDLKPYVVYPLLPRRVQSTPLSASSTQYMWELLARNCTAVPIQQALRRWIRLESIVVSILAPWSFRARPQPTRNQRTRQRIQKKKIRNESDKVWTGESGYFGIQ